MIRSDSRLRRLIAVALVCLLLDASGASVTLSDDLDREAVDDRSRRVAQATVDAAKAKRLEWFHEAKYGLFIHWGLYAIPAGQWKGRRIPGIGEWIMNRAQIPVKEYEQLAQAVQSRQVQRRRVGAARERRGHEVHRHHRRSITTASRSTIRKSARTTSSTPRRSSATCSRSSPRRARKHGMRLGFYYSQAQDWHEPNGAGNTWDFLADETKKDFDQYLRDKAEPQVRELLTDYGPVALIWFDTPRLMTDRARATLRRSAAIDAAQHADRRPPRHGGRLRHDRRQRRSRRTCRAKPGKCRRR